MPSDRLYDSYRQQRPCQPMARGQYNVAMDALMRRCRRKPLAILDSASSPESLKAFRSICGVPRRPYKAYLINRGICSQRSRNKVGTIQPEGPPWVAPACAGQGGRSSAHGPIGKRKRYNCSSLCTTHLRSLLTYLAIGDVIRSHITSLTV